MKIVVTIFHRIKFVSVNLWFVLLRNEKKFRKICWQLYSLLQQHPWLWYGLRKHWGQRKKIIFNIKVKSEKVLEVLKEKLKDHRCRLTDEYRKVVFFLNLNKELFMNLAQFFLFPLKIFDLTFFYLYYLIKIN
jgi:hypothetical protein